MQSPNRIQFYLGRRVEEGRVLAEQPLLYDAQDLTTHAVCVGMTGSGKTGLGVALVEEAALNGIPTLVIDPKGDMANLLLTFPDLAPADFLPWLDAEGVRRRGLSLDESAAEVARSWREGLAGWGIDGARIARLKEAAEFALYTPGSDAGRPIGILESLQAPELSWERDAEMMRESIASVISALLALVNVASDPVTGREHNLLSAIVERAWRAGEEVDLARLIVEVQQPPFDRLGVLPLETFYPEKERMALVLALNGLLASPRFAGWLEGEPLRAENLFGSGGRSKVSILYLAHLSDSERFFFVTLLLERVRTWMRAQQGTTRLRALLYFDELYGFMPPYPANPPTKAPLLALLKQGRSQGLGVVLATQNPVDLDYKGLSNAGSWFIGKLQTAHDRERVLEGLRGASLDGAASTERSEFAARIAQLEPRHFLLHNVHGTGQPGDPRLAQFKTRHTMSYLRGPLTRPQIQALVHGQPEDVPAPAAGANARPPQTAGTPLVAKAPSAPAREESLPRPKREAALAGQQDAPASPPRQHWDALATTAPVLPSGVEQVFLPVRVSLEWAIRGAEAGGQTIIYQDRQLIYRAALLARATVRIDDSRHNVYKEFNVLCVIPVAEERAFMDWDVAPLAVRPAELDDLPAQGARFGALPPLFSDGRRRRGIARDLAEHLYRDTVLHLPYHSALKLTAQVDETESQFKRRCYQEVAARRDAEVAKLEKSYETKIERLEARMHREERELDQDESEYRARRREEMISAGESVLNVLSGRRYSRMFSTASRRRRMTQQAKADIQESAETIEELEGQIADLADERDRERAAIHERWAEAADDLEAIRLRPRKSDVFVEGWGVAWIPHWDIVFEQDGEMKQLSLAAFEPEPSAD
jgi:hypothetical protein